MRRNHFWPSCCQTIHRKTLCDWFGRGLRVVCVVFFTDKHWTMVVSVSSVMHPTLFQFRLLWLQQKRYHLRTHSVSKRFIQHVTAVLAIVSCKTALDESNVHRNRRPRPLLLQISGFKVYHFSCCICICFRIRASTHFYVGDEQDVGFRIRSTKKASAHYQRNYKNDATGLVSEQLRCHTKERRQTNTWLHMKKRCVMTNPKESKWNNRVVRLLTFNFGTGFVVTENISAKRNLFELQDIRPNVLCLMVTCDYFCKCSASVFGEVFGWTSAMCLSNFIREALHDRKNNIQPLRSPFANFSRSLAPQQNRDREYWIWSRFRVHIS